MAPARTSSAAAWTQTLAALLTARRLVPAATVVVSLVLTEWFATGRADATFVLLTFCAVFFLAVPATARWASAGSSMRYVGYLLVCILLVLLTTWVAPSLLGYESYVAHPPATAAILALVAIAGWVLARDIELSGGLQVAEQRGVALQREADSARLLAIRSHLDPHFLFNTLGAIAEWCREDPLVAERALLELSSMLRTFFQGLGEAAWPMHREIELLRALHGLYALRDDERFRLTTQLDVPDDAEVPPLLLLALFENALTHGTHQAPMHLEVSRDGEDMQIRIWNAGEYNGRRTGGTGIDMTERRLDLAYGGLARLEVEPETVESIVGTSARVHLPMRVEPDAKPDTQTPSPIGATS